MSTSKEKVKKTLKKQSPSQNKKILLSCGVVTDGVGDFYHLLDLVDDADTFMDNYKKDIFITTRHDQSQIKDFEKNLREKGFEVLIIQSVSDFSEAMKSNKKMAFILDPRELSESEKNNIVRAINRYYAGKISISNDIFDSEGRIEKFTIPDLWFNEHGGVGLQKGSTDVLIKIRMNLLGGTQSLFLSQEDRNNPAQQLAEVLSKPENRAIKTAILGKDIKECTELKEICEKFLQNNLFVPSYLQHDPSAIVNFINTVTQSQLSDKYQSVVFFINKIKEDVLKKANVAGMLPKNVKTIIIKEKSGETVIINENASSSGKTITLVTGYRVQEDKDYKKLFHCAQYFAGCSGDKTFELVLSNGLIPLFIPHNLEKQKFIQDASKFDDHFKGVSLLYETSDLLRSMLQGLSSSAHNRLGKMRDYLLKVGVHEDEFPEVIKKWHTGRAFTIGGKIYRPDYNEGLKTEMIDFFVEQLFEIKNKQWDLEVYKEIEDGFISKVKNKEEFQEFLSALLIKFEVEGKDKKRLGELANKIADAFRDPQNIEFNNRKYVVKLSEEQEGELYELFLKEYLKLIHERFESGSKRIALLLNETFFKEWKALCQMLIQDRNLHKKISVIINNFFKKKGLEMDVDESVDEKEKMEESNIQTIEDIVTIPLTPPLIFTSSSPTLEDVGLKEKIKSLLTSFPIKPLA